MASRLTTALLLVSLCLVGLCHAQTTTNGTTTDNGNNTTTTATGNSTSNSTNNTACPITDDALTGVDFTGATTACANVNATGFCSSCLCSIANALVAGSPTFTALATSPSAALNLNLLVEQCAGTLGPALLSALTPDSLTTLAACDLNAAANTCGDSGSNSTAALNTTMPMEDSKPVTATQGPAAAAAPATPTPAARSGSSVPGVLLSALMGAPVLAAVLLLA